MKYMLKNTFLSLAWLSSCLVKTTWSLMRTITLLKLSLILNLPGHDNSYVLRLFFEHKKLQTTEITRTHFESWVLMMIEPN